MQITSSPVLRQLEVLFIGKLVAQNTRPLVLTFAAQVQGNRCSLDLKWRAAEPGAAVQDARAVLVKELVHIQEMVFSIGGELSLAEGTGQISLKLPAAPQAGRSDTPHSAQH